MTGDTGPDPGVVRVSRLDLKYEPADWPFAAARRDDIKAFYDDLKRRKPAVWNGRVLVLYRFAFAGDCLYGSFLETDFANLRAWVTWNYPPAGAWDCFGAAAVRGADGGWLLGVMGQHTSNDGQVYFPCGTPDPQDLKDGQVDFAFSVARELKEETGLAVDEFEPEPGWHVVRSGAFVVPIKVLRSRETAEALRARILAFLARDPQPELAGIRIVRGPADLDAAMPSFVQTFFRHRWQQE